MDKISKNLIKDIQSLIEAARHRVAQAVNTGLVMLYWSIGVRIRGVILKGKRAEYGEEIVSTLSRQLTAECGREYSRANLFNMIRMSEMFPEELIVQTLSRFIAISQKITSSCGNRVEIGKISSSR